MTRTWCMILLLVFPAGALLMQSSARRAHADRTEAPLWLPGDLLGDARVAVTPAQASRALARPAKMDQQKLESNPEISRGPALVVYRKIAPATVLVRTGQAYGTGFLVGEHGWILTNHHVVAECPIQVATGVRMALVHLGRMKDRVMEVDQTAIPALVYKTSEEKDLALLKLIRLPQGVARLPVVPLAEKAPVPGSECVAIGHPRAAMMWTVRSGEISGVGQWPQDMIHAVTERLSVSKRDAELLKKTLAALPKRKILISSCGVNPGDSGGPLLDDQGKLIGVTYAIPQAREGERIRVDKFSYHIHLDEVKTFLRERPAKPRPYIPDPWPAAIVSKLVDRTRDKILDTLAFSMARGKPLTGSLCDLDQDSSVDFDPEKLSDPAMRKAWDFEFAFQFVPEFRTFYDTDNDGSIDLILTDANRDGTADQVLKRNAGGWAAAKPGKQFMADPALFADKKIGRQLAVILGIAK